MHFNYNHLLDLILNVTVDASEQKYSDVSMLVLQVL